MASLGESDRKRLAGQVPPARGARGIQPAGAGRDDSYAQRFAGYVVADAGLLNMSEATPMSLLPAAVHWQTVIESATCMDTVTSGEALGEQLHGPRVP